ncbi:hypothetical protein B0H11DRAFT_2082626 [Mycena galericulata]|nr:hypothetical protein B0H11DRAFT_2082626 [Mycena galericulata]
MSSSSSPRTLATMPPEVHYHVLTALASFQDLGATVLAARPLHAAFDAHRRKVLSSVGRNFLGALFTDALLLARCLEKRDGSEALKVKGLSGSTVRLLVQNADTVGALQAIVFGLLKEDSAVDIHSKPSLTKFAKSPRVVVPSESESIRFKSAAYRFCVYCLLTTSDARIAFLNRFPKIQILELSHFVTGLWTLVSVIRGRPLDTDQDWELASNVLSTAPHSVLALWKMKQEKAGTDKAEFKAALKVASASSSSSASASSSAYYDGEVEGESFMGAWCDLMEAQRFPAPAHDEAQAHAHALDAGTGAEWQAILDSGNVRALAALAFAEQEEKEKRDRELSELEEAEPVVQPENRKKKVNGKGKQKKRGGLDDPFC